MYSSISLRSSVYTDPMGAFALGRFPIIVGESIGWFVGGALATQIDSQFLPWTMALLFALSCAHLSLSVALNPQTLMQSPDDLRSVDRGKTGKFEATTQLSDNISTESLDEVSASTITRESELDLSRKRCHIVGETYGLTRREEDVLIYLSRGRSARYIADNLVISEKTVKTHIIRIYRKLDTHSRQELIDIVAFAEKKHSQAYHRPRT